MAISSISVRRPERWDIPFGAEMTEELADRILEREPFKGIDAAKFPPELPLRGIILNDTRVAQFVDGSIVVRRGDYGGSAFFILAGKVQVVLGTEENALPTSLLGRRQPRRKGLVSSLAQLWRNSRVREVRREGNQLDHDERAVFLQGVDRVLDDHKTVEIGAGEFFGAVAALGRTPRAATVFARGKVVLLEIRWQGLRELRTFVPDIKEYIDQLYRENALKQHLLWTPMFGDIFQHAEVQSCITGARIARLFQEHMHWDSPEEVNEITVLTDNREFKARSVATQGTTVCFSCSNETDGSLPCSSARQEILSQIKALFPSHIIVHTDASDRFQIWQWVDRTTSTRYLDCEAIEPTSMLGPIGHELEVDLKNKSQRERLIGELLLSLVLEVIADRTVFVSHGSFGWQTEFKTLSEAGAASALQNEPIIAEQGHYPNGLMLIRSGFARLSEKFNHGERTVSYLARGQTFGLEELAHNWRNPDRTIPWQRSLRAIGYVDTLLVPTSVIEQFVLPYIAQAEIDQLIARAQTNDGKPSRIDTDLLESLVEKRFINGTATMMIDLNRCTRCDDCVRACADAHDNNPRFLRHGPKIGRYMVANACMHCVDPVCMIGCPTGAICRSSFKGQVIINDATCIGCAICANNCPYDNIRMAQVRDNLGNFLIDRVSMAPIMRASKCDLCVEQLGGPACERACPHDALARIDMQDLETAANWLGR